MPIIDIEGVRGIVEDEGKVRCSDCIEDWEKYFNDSEGEDITEDELNESRGTTVYICDYCGKRL